MATVLPERTPNPYGQAFSGMMNMALMQKNWNKFLDSMQGGGQGGGVDVSGSTQENPQAVYGAPPALGGGVQATIPQRPSPIAQMGARIGGGMNRIGRGIGNMFGGNQQPQMNALAGDPIGKMFGGGASPMMPSNPMTMQRPMSNLAPMAAGMGMGPMGMGINPLMLQMLMQRRMGGY